MARKTRAQLAEEAKIEKAKELAIMIEEYSNSFMEVLEKAQKNLYSLEIKDGKFILQSFKYEYESFSLILPSELAKDQDLIYSYYSAMAELKGIFESIEKSKAEKLRRQQIKEAALAKLSEEEREILFSN